MKLMNEWRSLCVVYNVRYVSHYCGGAGAAGRAGRGGGGGVCIIYIYICVCFSSRKNWPDCKRVARQVTWSWSWSWFEATK